MAYTPSTHPQRQLIRSLARDMGMKPETLAARIAEDFNTTLDGLGKREASVLISTLQREQDAVTLRGFAQKGAAID